MPGFDGTGPRGMGPMTGGGRGFCNPSYAGARAPSMGAYPYSAPYGTSYAPPYGAGYSTPYAAYPYGSFGLGRGFGGGRGFGAPGMSPFGQPMAPEQEINFLRDQAQMLKQQMDQIDARIKELEKGVK